MMDNERRADLGVLAIRAAAEATNVWTVETADTAIRDVLAYIAHVCDRFGLDPDEAFRLGLVSYRGDFEDGPPATKLADGTAVELAAVYPRKARHGASHR